MLEIISCGQPVVTEGSSGAQLAKNMKEGFDLYGINSCQIESCVLDGVYFHCSIQKHFDEIYNLQPGSVLYSWDRLHKSGLVDTHLGKQTQFAWLSHIIEVCVRESKWCCKPLLFLQLNIPVKAFWSPWSPSLKIILTVGEIWEKIRL